jgi:hypothetical protein
MSWQDYYHPRRFGRARADALHLQQREVGFIAGQVRKDLSHVVEEIANS